MMDFRSKTALITGASSGIGLAFAHALAGRGANVLLASRSRDRLEDIAGQISRQHGVQARAIAVDLSLELGADTAFAAARSSGLPIDILVNNAGYGTYGSFETLETERDHREIMLNVVALARLTHLAVPGMLERGAGVVMNVASAAAFQPLPYMAVYAATKAFVLSFSEALWAEYRDRGIRVLAVCPGPTETEFFKVVGSEQAAGVGRRRSAEQVVGGALQALDKGKSFYVDGRLNYLQAFALRLAPRAVVAKGAAAVMKPRPGSAR